jgi:hypothetical protein
MSSDECGALLKRGSWNCDAAVLLRALHDLDHILGTVIVNIQQYFGNIDNGDSRLPSLALHCDHSQ